ncbi:MAG TPA: cupin domain-containing protein [Solirubrobacterales bacterium]|nr:cupin domain-containing protein [Solirubrobacterales bacterium]
MADERQVVWMPGGVRTEIQLDGEDTGGAFCLLVDEPLPGWALPPHIHVDAAETIHVVAGEFELTVDGGTVRLGPGQTLHVPAGVVHSGRHVGELPGRRLLVFSPAGMEEFFREAGAASPAAEPDRRAVLAAAGRHGWRFPDPPR